MSSRNIAVQKNVYDALMQEKRAGESFTAVLRRLLDQRAGAEELSGVWGRPDLRLRGALRGLRTSGRRR